MSEEKIRVLIAKPGLDGTTGAPKSLRGRCVTRAWKSSIPGCARRPK